MKKIFAIVALLVIGSVVYAQNLRMDTYCNPLNVDYTYMIYNSEKNISYRSGADPAVVEFRGEYYMFVTRSHGYWHSKDLQNWDFIKANDWILRAVTPLLPITIRILFCMYVETHQVA